MVVRSLVCLVVASTLATGGCASAAPRDSGEPIVIPAAFRLPDAPYRDDPALTGPLPADSGSLAVYATIDQRYRDGLRAMQNGEFDRAAVVFELLHRHLLEAPPDLARDHADRTGSFAHICRAIARVRARAERDLDAVAFHREMGAGYHALARHAPAEAVIEFRNALARRPWDRHAQNQLVRARADAGRPRMPLPDATGEPAARVRQLYNAGKELFDARLYARAIDLFTRARGVAVMHADRMTFDLMLRFIDGIIDKSIQLIHHKAIHRTWYRRFHTPTAMEERDRLPVVQVLLHQAETALSEGRLEDALETAFCACYIHPAHPPAVLLREQIEALLAGPCPPAHAMGPDDIEDLLAEVRHETRRHVETATRLLVAGHYRDADNAAATALEVVRWSPYSDDVIRALGEQAIDLRQMADFFTRVGEREAVPERQPTRQR